MIRGYARVSTADQNLTSQLEALTKAGTETIYQEKVSGAKRDREQLRVLMQDLQAGDVLLVTRLDRLARSTLDLLTILEEVNKRGAAFRSLADSWADTTTPHGRLMLTILGGLAEFERSLILARTGEGRRRAMAAGVKFGRRAKMTPEAKIQAAQRVQAGEPHQAVADDYGVSTVTIWRLLRPQAA